MSEKINKLQESIVYLAANSKTNSANFQEMNETFWKQQYRSGTQNSRLSEFENLCKHLICLSLGSL